MQPSPRNGGAPPFQMSFILSEAAILPWCGFQDIFPSQWINFDKVGDWWTELAMGAGWQSKAMAALTMIVLWGIWKEHTARVFHNHANTVIVMKIEDEDRLWGTAGALALRNVIPGEQAYFASTRMCPTHLLLLNL